RVGLGVAGTGADGVLRIDDDDLADAALAGIGGLADGFDHAVKPIVGNGHVDFYLGQKGDDVFRTAIQLGVPLLAAEAFDFGHRDALNADLRQGFTHVVQFERFDDGSD